MNNVSFNEVKLLVDLPLLAIPRSSGVVLASVVDVSFLNNSNLSTTEPILQLSQSHVEHALNSDCSFYGFIIVLVLCVRECGVNSPEEGAFRVSPIQVTLTVLKCVL